MRFKKGSKVEVFYRREVPSGSWRCAEILSGNGHTYRVMYDHCPMDMESAAERVPRKAIRPCPPFVDGLRCWVPGDIVEVFDDNPWKLAEVSRVFMQSYFFVRLLGLSMEFKVHSSNIRMQQSWEDNSWAIIQKDSSKHHNGTRSMLPKEGVFVCQELKTCLEENSYAGVGHLTDENLVARVSSEGAKKRSRACSLFVETCAGVGKKIRTIKKEGSNYQLVAVNSPGPKLEAVKLASLLVQDDGGICHLSSDVATQYMINIGLIRSTRRRILGIKLADELASLSK